MSGDPAAREVVFAVPFSWNSSIGHLVELVVDHVAPGLVIEIDAGRAPAAERLRRRGYEFAATVGRTDDLAGLHERGLQARHLGLDGGLDPVQLASTLRTLATEAAVPPVAVLLDGVLDRVPAPDLVLDGVARFVAEFPGVLVGVGVANVAHRAVAVPMLSGRFEPLGPGPHHHTRAALLARMAAAGFVERHRHDRAAPEIKPADAFDPAVSEGAQLGSFLHRVRTDADPTADVAALVALYAPGAADPPAADRRTPTLAVALASGMSADVRAAIERQLAAQSADDLEVVDLGREPGATLGALRHPYVTILRGDEQLTEEWAAQFLAAIGWYPGAIIRCASTRGAWPALDSFYGLLQGPTAPDAAFAIPTAVLRAAGDIAVVDGHPELYPVLLAGAARCGIVDTGVPALDVADSWSGSGSDPAVARPALDVAPLLVPMGSATYLADIHDAHRTAHARAEQLAAENRALHEQLGRRPVAALLRVLGLLGRVRRRSASR